MSEVSLPAVANSGNIELSVIMPVLNERHIIKEAWQRVSLVLKQLNVTGEIIFVDGGSTDGTTEILREISSLDQNVSVLVFSRNFGQQAAFTAGLDCARGNAVIMLDSDLQDPPELILQMYAEWKNGYQVVYSRRAERQGESVFKRATAAVFYRLLKLAAGGNIPVDAGDFKLLDRQVVEAIKTCPERSRFMRGMVAWAGFRDIGVEYVRNPRTAGETKYSLWKMTRLSVDAFLSSSRAPLRLSTWLGIMLSLTALLTRIREGSRRDSQPLSASTLFFLHGLGMLCQGILGEYIARIHLETQARPNYIIATVFGPAANEKPSAR